MKIGGFHFSEFHNTKKSDVFSRFAASPRALRHMAEPGHCAGHALNRVWLLRARHAHPARRMVAVLIVVAYEARRVMTCGRNSSCVGDSHATETQSAHSVHTHECADHVSGGQLLVVPDDPCKRSFAHSASASSPPSHIMLPEGGRARRRRRRCWAMPK